MDKIELIEIFKTFNSDDWNEFYNMRIYEQPIETIIDNTKLINDKLSAIWITRPEIITKEFVLWLLEKLDAKQFVWEDLGKWIDNQIELFWSLELAFDDLVTRYL